MGEKVDDRGRGEGKGNIFLWDVCIILFEKSRSKWIFRSADSSQSSKPSWTRCSRLNSIRWIYTASRNGQSFPTCSLLNKSIWANSSSTSKPSPPSPKPTAPPSNAETNPPCLTNPERTPTMIRATIPTPSTPAKRLEAFDLRVFRWGWISTRWRRSSLTLARSTAGRGRKKSRKRI